MSIFFNDTATTEIYTLSLHDALPIWMLYAASIHDLAFLLEFLAAGTIEPLVLRDIQIIRIVSLDAADRKSTRLNSSHANISYAVFCLKPTTTTTAPLTSSPTRPLLST